MQDQQIVRRWTGVVRSEDAKAYVAYVRKTGLAGYVETKGNLGAQLATRDLGDGRTEIMTLSWWRSMADIAAFAGSPVDQARYYPEDDKYLVERPEKVEHFIIVGG
ncbi:hypothetical protein H8M03_00435 [Sphingomonas sabuli]|uniref:Antibiotic biosynthesis monooxygenase n=1 Tax=Sphingomonas sabuli TaxID=2764186 RepID=A0A7G9L2M8_9SPHN|nr:hypothetical protein [Sphingomonas sabuli]QNM82877.1 hypothetical protein H8M03_00435 [Sphingomonas sabuli]